MKPIAKYWKFRNFSTPYHIQSLKEESLWFANPEDFNDSMDNSIGKEEVLTKCIGTIYKNRESISESFKDNERKSFLEQIQMAEQGLLMDEWVSLYDVTSFLKEAHCCFAKSYENKQLWAYYGGENQGFSLGFSDLNRTSENSRLLPLESCIEKFTLNFPFQKEKILSRTCYQPKIHMYESSIEILNKDFIQISRESGILQDINYTELKTREVLINNLEASLINYFRSLDKRKSLKSISIQLETVILQLKFLKDTSWKHEEEVRLISKIPEFSDINGFSVQFDPRELTDIVLGSKIKQKDKNEIINICEDKEWKHVKVWQLGEDSLSGEYNTELIE